jgi:hypothetical protein
MASIYVKCERCSGKGIIKVFGHVLGGVCFRCRVKTGPGPDDFSACGAGSYMAEVSFNGHCLQVNRAKFHLATLRGEGRKAMIDRAAKLLADMENATGPRGWMLAELFALAAAADETLRGRILRAVSLRIVPDEQEDVAVLSAALGLDTTRCTQEA